MKTKGYLDPLTNQTGPDEDVQYNGTKELSQDRIKSEDGVLEIKDSTNDNTTHSYDETVGIENVSEAVGQTVRRNSNSDQPAANDLQFCRDQSPPALPMSSPPQLESLANTILEEEETELRQKQSEKPETSSNVVLQRRPLSLQPTPTKPGAISSLALSRTTSSGERRSLSVAAPRRSQSFVLGLEAAPGGGSLVNSVAGSVHKHRQQFLQRRSMFEAPADSPPRRNSRPFEIELRALKLGTRTLDGDARPAVQSRRQSWRQQTLSNDDTNALTEKQSALS